MAEHKHSSPQVRRMEITPALARAWLDGCNEKNRRISKLHAERLASLMRRGEWHTETHEAIAFDTDGQLIDGQHRLQAVVLCGMATTMNVWMSVDPEARKAVDTGKSRSITDVVRINTGMQVTRTDFAILKWFVFGDKRSAVRHTMSTQQAINLHTEFQQHVDVSKELVPKKTRLHPAPLRGLVARAWLTEDRDGITDFCRAFTTGVAQSDTMQSAIMLRDLYTIRLAGNLSGPIAYQFYRKSQTALSASLAGQSLKSLRETKLDIFPLPGHIQADVDECLKAPASVQPHQQGDTQ